MKMVWNERPGKARGGGVEKNRAQPRQEVVAIGIVPKNLFPLNPSADDMVERAGRIDSCFTWHSAMIAAGAETINL